MRRYAEWCRRQGKTAQCSPVLGVLGILFVMAVVIYTYRQIIVTTIIDAVLAAVGVAIFVATIAVTISTIRWYRKKSAVPRAEIISSETVPIKPTTDADTAAISDEADWLASGVELAFGPDGKTLVARDKK